MGSELTSKEKVGRLIKIKRNLDKYEYTNKGFIEKELGNGRAGGVLWSKKIIDKNRDGFWYWRGNTPNIEMAEDVWKEMRKVGKSKTKRNYKRKLPQTMKDLVEEQKAIERLIERMA